MRQIKKMVHILKDLRLAMVGPITSEQITLSFGNSIIIAGVRARMMTCIGHHFFILDSLLVIVGLKITLNFSLKPKHLVGS